MKPSQAVAVHDLAQSFGVSAILRVPRLQVNSGETVCIRGHNGSGKTALLRLLMGLGRDSCRGGGGIGSGSGHSPHLIASLGTAAGRLYRFCCSAFSPDALSQRHR